MYVCNCNGLRQRDVAFAIQAGAIRPRDVFDRHLGLKTPLAIDRSKTPNRLAKDGGLLITFPIR